MKLAHFYPPFAQPGGVPSEARFLCDAMARQGVPSTIFCLPGEQRVSERAVTLHHLPASRPSMLAALARELSTSRASIDALVLYGAFSPINVAVAMISRRNDVPYIVSPEGVISPSAFSNSGRMKKIVYWTVLERPMFVKATALRVLSRFEEESLTRMGIRTPMFIAAEGTPPEAILESDRRTEQTASMARTFLFLGRLDIWQKGLDYLLAGFADSVRQDNRGQRLILAGPSCGRALHQLRILCSRLGLAEGLEVKIYPPVRGQAKWDLFHSADVFIHPSRREGIPRVIREAMAMRLPMIITAETNMGTAVAEREAGWCVPASRSGVRDGILAALAATDLPQRSRAAAILARNEYSWDRIASDFLVGLERVLK